MEKPINIYFFADYDLFDAEKIKNLQKFGNVIFLKKDKQANFDVIKKDKKEKFYVYDPDYSGWEIPDYLISDVENIKAIFLGTTDKSYLNNKLCEEKEIQVVNIPRYASDSVAEYLVMFMFACAKKLPLQIKNENKQKFDDTYLQMQLKEKKVGIVGLGNIGAKIAAICDGIGMKVVYWDRKIKQTNYVFEDLENLFRTCDVIYLCLAINDETKKIVTDSLLNSMKDGCIFISCTGKQLLNYSLVEKRIENNTLFGYAFEDPDISLNEYKGNVMVTSEYAWFTKDAALLRIKKWYELIITFLCDRGDISKTDFIEKHNIQPREYIFCKIRKANESDLTEIARLYKEQNWFGENNSVSMMKKNYGKYNKNDFLLVAEYKGNIVGTVTTSINRAYAFNCMKYMTFDYLVVDSNYRRKRVGTQLINHLFSYAKENQLESVWVCSSVGRDKAHKFYDYVGFNDPVKGFRKVFIEE